MTQETIRKVEHLSRSIKLSQNLFDENANINSDFFNTLYQFNDEFRIKFDKLLKELQENWKKELDEL